MWLLEPVRWYPGILITVSHLPIISHAICRRNYSYNDYFYNNKGLQIFERILFGPGFAGGVD